jgi:hypothetical protein
MSGSRANKSGRTAESILKHTLELQGFNVQPQYKIGNNIYGGILKIDLFVKNALNFPDGLAIESKWQDVNGSADEKLPYLVQNIRECYPCPTIVVLQGGGIRQGAIQWIKSQIDDKLIGVYSLEEFISWAMRHLK